MTYNAVGKPLGRLEGPAKVTGAATYSADIQLPGMVWGKVLRSPLPHARIVHIDTSAAERLPGVLAVLSAKDLPDLLIGRRVYDMPVLAKDRVRFIGEKVAIVAAEDPDIAEEALAHIEIEDEELPAVIDAQEAMKPDAPVLHPQYRLYPHAPAKYFSDLPNVHSHVTWQLGDVEKGFAAAAQVFERTFTTHYAHQGYIETHASVVAIETDGRAHVWLSNKMPFRTRELLADVVQIPQEQILVHLIPIGGDFGGKGSLMDLPLCYQLARHTGRLVKMLMTYSEELMAGNPRHPTTMVLRSLSFAEVAQAALAHERPLRVQKIYRVSEYPHMTGFIAQAVELEVDPETGQMTLLDVVTAHDVGTIINPLSHQGQIEGGLIQGIGFGMIEEMRAEDGRVSTLSLGDYKIPNIKDIPPLKTVLVQEELGPVPFQGKSIGESSITPITAAIANALYDAVGVRICDLPITAEKVYRALQVQRETEEDRPEQDRRRR